MASYDVNRRAKLAVVNEIRVRGGVVLDDGAGSKPIRVSNQDGSRTIEIEVHGKTSGDWQTKTTKGAARAKLADETEFWILVDLGDNAPEYYVFEKWWMQNDIYTEHKNWLASVGGIRPVTPHSDHHAIRASRREIQDGRDHWERLRIFN